MAFIKPIFDKFKNIIYPKTVYEAVYDLENNTTLDTEINSIKNNYITKNEVNQIKSELQDKITDVDATATVASQNFLDLTEQVTKLNGEVVQNTGFIEKLSEVVLTGGSGLKDTVKSLETRTQSLEAKTQGASASSTLLSVERNIRSLVSQLKAKGIDVYIDY